MPSLEPYIGPTKLVIAFDIGTTFSRISYCLLERGQVPEVHGVTRSPVNAEVTASDVKIPSILYYDRTGNVTAAGVETLARSITDSALMEGWTKVEWWKLHLHPMRSASDNLPPLPPGKSAVHVLTDFIKYLSRCAKAYIKKRHLALRWSSVEHSVEYIFTHPNGWECAQLYHSAIQWASLVPSTPSGRSRVHMLSEGEASLHFCIANLIHMETDNHTAPEAVVIIDAGGGTINLNMFSMTSNPISYEEIAPAECRLQGSIFVARRAEVLLKEKLEGWEHSTPEEIAEFTREFDQTTKLLIETDKDPAYVRIAGRRTTIPRYNISFGQLKLMGEEATGLFDDSINAIISAFEQQQKFVQIPVTMGFLVGGFASNNWLWSRVQSYFRDKNINVYRPDNHITEVVAHGAVLSVVDRDNHVVISQVAHATYGVVCSVLVDPSRAEHICRKDKWVRGESGGYYMEDYFDAKIYKGNQVHDEMEFRDSYSLTKANPIDFCMETVQLVCYHGKLSKLEWMDQDPLNFSTYCYIHVDLSQATQDVVPKRMPSGKVYYQLDFDVIVFFGSMELKAQLSWKTRGSECQILAMVSFEHSMAEEGSKGLQQLRKVVQLQEQLEPTERKAQSVMVPALDSNQAIEQLGLDEISWIDTIRSLSDSPSEMTMLQQECADLLKDSSSVRCQLQESLLTCDKKTVAITSLPAKDATTAQHITALCSDIKSLRDNISVASSRIQELEQRQGAVYKELQTRAALIEERGRIIAMLTAEVAQLKYLNIEKSRLITTVHRDLQPYVQCGVVQALPVDADDEGRICRRTTLETNQASDCYIPEASDWKRPMGTANRDHEWAQKDSPQTTELQKRYDPQSSIPGIFAFQQWMSGDSIDADKPLLGGNPSLDIHNMLAYNALLEARAKNWSSAYNDANKSIETQPSAMGYIAKALSQAGGGELEKAMLVFDLAFGSGNSSESNLLLLVIKAIILFVAGKCDDAITRIHNLISILGDDEMAYCCIRVLGKIYIMQGDYGRAVESLERGRNLASTCTGRHLEIISIIFGWTFEDFQATMLRCQCEISYNTGQVVEAADALLRILNILGEEKSHARGVPAARVWVRDLKGRCIGMLERLGDSTLDSGRHEEAIAHYSFALSLHTPNLVDILIKRSKARALLELWEGALMDANEVIRLDPSSHQGYERKYVALHGAEKHGEANNALLHMFSIIEKSQDEEIRRQRENYTAPRDAIKAIDTGIREVFNLCPLVLIDLTTGRLCNAEERVQIFKSEMPFKRLVSETVTMKLDHARIHQAVAKYFRWAMFSHRWEGKEPTFRDVDLVDSVWNLDHSPLNEKLRGFCSTAREDGHRWAWSDTCCIDKSTSATLSQSLTSMYTWYEEAAETLVYLADVPCPAERGDLMKSLWMTRAWTLQELLASKVVRFYNKEWKLYLSDEHRNHKESPSIKQELVQAMCVKPEAIISFQPESLGVREKLRLASTRNATLVEDIAHSLIGIFSSDIAPRYGLGKTVLGQLLEDIVARTGDVTVIAWTGKSSSYNSALPDSLAVYSQMPPAMEADEPVACVEQLRARVAEEDALTLYHRVIRLPRADFRNRCLRLPCIMFLVSRVGVQELNADQGYPYRAIVSGLGKVEFRTAYKIQLNMPLKLVFIYAWLHDLRNSFEAVVSDHGQSGARAQPDHKLEAHDDPDPCLPVSPLHAEPLTLVDERGQALWLVAQLRRPFNALMLERQSNGQYKRIATEHEIIISEVLCQTNPKDLQVKVLEII